MFLPTLSFRTELIWRRCALSLASLLAVGLVPLLASAETPFVFEGVAPFETDEEREMIALSVDGSGAPHIAFMEGSFFILPVQYATKSAGVWTVEEVDAGAWTSSPAVSIDVDQLGRPSVVYSDVYEYNIAYELTWARKESGAWNIEIAYVAPGAYGGVTSGNNSLVLDSDGFPCIAHTYGTEDAWGAPRSALAYARRNAGGWTISDIDSRRLDEASAGMGCALALAPDGTPHISYIAAKSGVYSNLMYARSSGAVWQLEIISPGVGASTAIDLDAQENPHVAYRGPGGTSLIYARKAAGSWQMEAAVSGAYFLNGFVSLELDSWGNPHVCGVDQVADDLIYARKIGGQWMVDAVDGLSSEIRPVAPMRLAGGRSARVAYLDWTTHELRYARAQKTRVATPDGPGMLASITSPLADLGTSIIVRPNPVIDGRATILFAHSGGNLPAHAEIYDVSGRRIAAVPVGASGRGVVEATWDGTNTAGDPVAAGAYVVRVETASGARTCRIALVR
jgi:hypothetical protein